ncbi:hypothetical protein GHK52_03785 [Lactococcus garvieae]|nr:hypothetical protein [Lactococcus garvieae]
MKTKKRTRHGGVFAILFDKNFLVVGAAVAVVISANKHLNIKLLLSNAYRLSIKVAKSQAYVPQHQTSCSGFI